MRLDRRHAQAIPRPLPPNELAPFHGDAALGKRGSLLIWLDKEKAWLALHEGRPGRTPVLMDAAIPFCLSNKVLFRIPLQQSAGRVARLLQRVGVGWPVPDWSTLCRKQQTLKLQIPYRRSGGPLYLLMDAAPWRRHCSEGHGEGHRFPRRWRENMASRGDANGARSI